MTRRFQFRALLGVMAAVAVACAIWATLPAAVRFAVGAAGLGMLMWAMEWLMPDHRRIFDWIVRGDSNHKHVIRLPGDVSSERKGES